MACTRMRFILALLLFCLAPIPVALAASGPLSETAIDNASLEIPTSHSYSPSAAIAKLEVLLDRAGASPGVIDGFNGSNLSKALQAFAVMQGASQVGKLTPDLLQKLSASDKIMTHYTITEKDVSAIVQPIPADYAEMAKRDFLGFTSVAEAVAERFHMDEDLLKKLNPSANYRAGDELLVTDPGVDVKEKVSKIVADKALRQVRGYAADGQLVVAYPATIGSTDNPSPSGTHRVAAVVNMPNYTYDPSVNFKQGNNTEKLVLPPGPNGPVGSVWIDLTEPTFGIHGTSEPSEIDKTASHGCVRLTNWDAEELAALVEKGVPVEFAD